MNGDLGRRIIGEEWVEGEFRKKNNQWREKKERQKEKCLERERENNDKKKWRDYV